ncbi:MAG: NUDIX domain-containing protein [Candidatus Dactylopiibacterium sp.]|nr:NUDIX domain-containing protein [Candidatus Dactylopiibacterium sp.]
MQPSTPLPAARQIRIAAALVTRADGHALLVRKRGTHIFMQPGGKIEAGEAPAEALCRELLEEIGVRLRPDDLAYAGCYSAPAANEPGFSVLAEVFTVRTEAVPTARAEIEELVWIDPLAPPADLPIAPLSRTCILPLCGLGTTA